MIIMYFKKMRRDFFMEIREGLIPTVLGTAVAATGAMMKRRDMAPMIAAGIVGFGLAHVVLGAIDLVEHMDER
jgi:hypothetical protein